MVETAVSRENATDTDLMLAYRDGDNLSFNELYQRHRTPLYQFILNSCSNEATAAELFQDVWSSVTNARHSYTDSANFHAWIYRIARNRLIDAYRVASSNPLKNADRLDEDTQITSLQAPLLPEEVAEACARESALSSALNTLPVVQKEVVLLRHIAGFTLEEIAALVDEKPETVKSRLRYAFTKLRNQVRLQA